MEWFLGTVGGMAGAGRDRALLKPLMRPFADGPLMGLRAPPPSPSL